MTSPPAARILVMAAPYVDHATGVDGSPFHVIVHEPRDGVCRKARVRYAAPDWCDSCHGLSGVYASKYGVKRCAGRREPASAAAALVGAAIPVAAMIDAPAR